jgi:hypothetical protein
MTGDKTTLEMPLSDQGDEPWVGMMCNSSI